MAADELDGMHTYTSRAAYIAHARKQGLLSLARLQLAGRRDTLIVARGWSPIFLFAD
jgi:hypothetical protein